MRRSEQRRAAVVALYQHDVTGRPVDATLTPGAHVLTRALTHAAAVRATDLDAVIDRHAHGWAVQRIGPLERSILRVALTEILYPAAVPADVPIPPEGAIEEAVMTAKLYCGTDAPGFINGVLAAALRDLRDNGSPTPTPLAEEDAEVPKFSVTEDFGQSPERRAT